ncbi:MAG: thiamine-phosphate kinase, partial [Verrucomicrobiales bacterium]
ARAAMRAAPTLREVGEDGLVARLTRGLPLGRDVVVGPGDDCAVLRVPGNRGVWQLLKTDVVVEGVHFTEDTPPAAVGWKAASRAVSDIAAMGGRPTHAVVTAVAPGVTPASWMVAAYCGLVRCAKTYGFSLVGGETSGTAVGGARLLNVAMLGEVERRHCVLRSGARVGNALFVTGKLGGSLASGRHLRFRPRLAEAGWLVRNFRPTALMDLSDGLGRDLPRLAAASGVGWEIDTDLLPLHRGCSASHALMDGEDFELLFAMPSRRTTSLEAAWKQVFPEVPLTRIGTVASRGRGIPALNRGYAHFSL